LITFDKTSIVDKIKHHKNMIKLKT